MSPLKPTIPFSPVEPVGPTSPVGPINTHLQRRHDIQGCLLVHDFEPYEHDIEKVDVQSDTEYQSGLTSELVSQSDELDDDDDDELDEHEHLFKHLHIPGGPCGPVVPSFPLGP